jgi:hypothetical protein
MRQWVFLVVLFSLAAGPVSQPLSPKDQEIADLRRIIAGLQKQVADLKTENGELKAANAELNRMLPGAGQLSQKTAKRKTFSERLADQIAHRNGGLPTAERLERAKQNAKVLDDAITSYVATHTDLPDDFMQKVDAGQAFIGMPAEIYHAMFPRAIVQSETADEQIYTNGRGWDLLGAMTLWDEVRLSQGTVTEVAHHFN